MENLDVVPISFKEIRPWLLEKHYAHKIPPISWAFGLVFENDIVGVISYGKPSSSSLCSGICGTKYSSKVYELNRLCINSYAPKNSASRLISKSLKLLPKGIILVSYADTNQGHIGYVYQATNWIYTGLSAKRTDWKLKGFEDLHGQTITDLSRGKKNRAKFMRDTYGDSFYLEDRPRKHRYIYFTDKKFKKHLKYEVLPYPKGESKRYECDDIRKNQMMFNFN